MAFWNDTTKLRITGDFYWNHELTPCGTMIYKPDERLALLANYIEEQTGFKCVVTNIDIGTIRKADWDVEYVSFGNSQGAEISVQKSGLFSSFFDWAASSNAVTQAISEMLNEPSFWEAQKDGWNAGMIEIDGHSYSYENGVVRRKHIGSVPEIPKIATGTSGNEMAMVIDVQDLYGMNPEDAKDYLNKLSDTLTGLREKGTPVTWVTMAKGLGFWGPAETKAGEVAQTRDIEQLKEMGFHGVEPSQQYRNSNHEIFRAFLLEHGPRTDEAVVKKSSKSALLEKSDLESRPEYTKMIETRELGETAAEYFGSQRTLADYAREKNIGRVLIMGAFSDHCVAETAISAAVKGLQTTVMTDLVLSRSIVQPMSLTPPMWQRQFYDPKSEHKWHEKKVRETTDARLEDGRRHYTTRNVAAINKIVYTTVDPALTANPDMSVTTDDPKISAHNPHMTYEQ